MEQRCKDIYNILNDIYKVPKSELNYDNLFQLLIGVILSGQCTDKRVNQVTESLFKSYKTSKDFLNLSNTELEKMIYSCGLYKSKAKNILNLCKILEEDYNGVVPDEFDKLVKLPGVGRKTANVVLSAGFKKSAIAVDTHVFRVSHRLNLSSAKTPGKTEFDLREKFDKNLWSNLHFYLVLFGRYTCKSKNPNCENCRLKHYCVYFKEKK